ncbi:MAG: hypothetical protein V8R81_08545 [Clostridia bacterium]|jgi:hypothetical protein|nr:MAG TPA: tail connector protein [Caudoviricetes sp.]
MLEQIKKRLGANYIENTDNIIQDIIVDMTFIACDASNRKETDKKLFPYIKKAVISEYNARGSEGLLSRNEGSISSSFNDIEKKLRIDAASIRIFK